MSKIGKLRQRLAVIKKEKLFGGKTEKQMRDLLKTPEGKEAFKLTGIDTSVYSEALNTPKGFKKNVKQLKEETEDVKKFGNKFIHSDQRGPSSWQATDLFPSKKHKSKVVPAFGRGKNYIAIENLSADVPPKVFSDTGKKNRMYTKGIEKMRGLNYPKTKGLKRIPPSIVTGSGELGQTPYSALAEQEFDRSKDKNYKPTGRADAGGVKDIDILRRNITQQNAIRWSKLKQRIAQVRLAVRPKKVASTKQEVVNAMKEGKPMRTEKPLRHGERLPPTYETDGKNFLLYGNKILSKQGDGYQTHVKGFINDDNYVQITLDSLRDFGMKVDSKGVIDSTKQFFTKDGLAMETKTNGDLTKSDIIIPANEISEGRVLVNKYKPPTGIKRDTYPYTPENLRNFAAESRRRVTSMQVNSEGKKVPEGTLKGDPSAIRKRSLSETTTQPEDAKEINRILGLPEEQGLENTFGKKKYDEEKTSTTYNKGKYRGIEGSKTHHILFKEKFKEKNKRLPLARFKHTRNVKATPKGSFANPFANNPSNAIQLSDPEHKELHRLNPHSNFSNIMESKLRIARLKIARIRMAAESGISMNPKHGRTIADAFDTMQHTPNSPKVKASYNALINETMDQANALQKKGIKFTPEYGKKGADYGGDIGALHDDIEKNKNLFYRKSDNDYKGFEDNPMFRLTDIRNSRGHRMRANDVFRSVHDINGHNLAGRSDFTPLGEHKAYLQHRKMYSPLASKALFTETAGQANWSNYSKKHGAKNRYFQKINKLGNLKFPQQKAGLLPDNIIGGNWHQRLGKQRNISRINIAQKPVMNLREIRVSDIRRDWKKQEADIKKYPDGFTMLDGDILDLNQPSHLQKILDKYPGKGNVYIVSSLGGGDKPVTSIDSPEVDKGFDEWKKRNFTPQAGGYEGGVEMNALFRAEDNEQAKVFTKDFNQKAYTEVRPDGTFGFYDRNGNPV